MINGHMKEKHAAEYHQCEKCDFRATTKAHLNGHRKEKHSAENHQCDKCKFKGNSKTDLAWHIGAMHKAEEEKTRQAVKDDRDICKFWMRGYCKFSGEQCRFKHFRVKRCYQGDNCVYWPNCRYSHFNGSYFEM